MAWYQFCDGIFEFYTAHCGSYSRDKRIVFRVREDTTPEERAKEKKIENYDLLLPSTDEEVKSWMEGHKGHKGKVFQDIFV